MRVMNPPCICRRSSQDYFCDWCPQEPYEEPTPLCQCQLHWITSDRSGVCYSCLQLWLQIPHRFDILQRYLDRITTRAPRQIEANLGVVITQSEVQGQFLLTTTVDEKGNITTRVHRPRGEQNFPEHLSGVQSLSWKLCTGTSVLQVPAAVHVQCTLNWQSLTGSGYVCNCESMVTRPGVASVCATAHFCPMF